MVSSTTGEPGRSRIFSTRPDSGALIQRISSGTSVPCPWTCRTIPLRLTVSDQTVAGSTVGAAARRRDRPKVAPPRITAAATA